MAKVEFWNVDVDFGRMNRLDRYDAKDLKPGDHVFYVNMNDEVGGVVYEATVLEKYTNQILLECFPVIETLPDHGLMLVFIEPHKECISYFDFCSNTMQMLFKNLIYIRRVLMTYNEIEIQEVMKKRNLTRAGAKKYIYHRNYYNNWIVEHKEEKRAYRKNYYETKLR